MRGRLVRFFLIVSLFLSYTAFKATQLWPSQRALAVVFSVLLFVSMLGGTFVYRSNPKVFEAKWFQALVWTGSLVMGLWATFVMVSLPLDLIHLVFPFRGFYIYLFSFSLLLVGLGFLQFLQGPRIKNVKVSFENLAPPLRGFKIAQISDLHVGTTVRKAYVEEVVRRTNAADPDIVILTGDIADAYPDSITGDLEPLKGFRTRYGVFYTTGNHEYYWGAQALVEKFKAVGFQPLLNENKILQVGSAKLLVAGLTDPMGSHMSGKHLGQHKPDIHKALANSESVQIKILLSHRSDVNPEAEKLGVDIQFSGHTHAGQFFPFSLLIGLAHKYTRGLYRQGNLWVYVNPGTGYWGPPNRLGVSSEITLVTLSCLV